MLEQETTGTIESDSEEPMLSPNNIVDLVIFGRRLRALRVLNGFDRVRDMVSILRSKYGVDVSDRTVYAIERGEQMPHIDFILAVSAILEPPNDYFTPAYRSDVTEMLAKRNSR